MVVCGAVIVEVKSVERSTPIHHAQILAYLRVTGLRVGLLLNFNSEVLRTSIRRFAM